MNGNISPVTSITNQTRFWNFGEGSEGREVGESAAEEGRQGARPQLERIKVDIEEMDSGYSTEAARDEGTGAAFQVIILGGGGGPGENDTTGLLVRSTATEWTKGSVMAVDAGVHLSAIDEIFKQHLPNAVKVDPPPKRFSRLSHQSVPIQPGDPSKPKFFPPVTETRGASRAPSPVDASPVQQMGVMTSGPFSSLMVPYNSSAAISAYFLRNLISTILITHAHLDHLSGFAINTAGLQNTTKPKKIVGLPGTIEAIKTHIFNDVIWPNMSDEEGGIGFVSYQRLSEGGHSLLGENEAAGYIEVCDSLATKAYLVSHGNCVKRHKHRGSVSVESSSSSDVRRRSSRFDSFSSTSVTPVSAHPGSEFQPSVGSGGWNTQRCVVDSSAFFIRDEETTQEILIFGDVEPDKVSTEPRNHVVWAEAAPKVARRGLTAIFIECSYDDSQGDAVLFGHLAPRHLVAELAMLAAKATAFRQGITNYGEAQPKDPTDSPNGFAATVPAIPLTGMRRGSVPSPAASRKRPHESPARRGSTYTEIGESTVHSVSTPVRSLTPLHPHAKKRSMTAASRPLPERNTSGISPLSSPVSTESSAMAGAMQAAWGASLSDDTHGQPGGTTNPDSVSEFEVSPPESNALPLEGIRVVIIHVKDPLRDDWDPREVILRQLKEHEREWRLGCEFVMSKRGDSIWI